MAINSFDFYECIEKIFLHFRLYDLADSRADEMEEYQYSIVPVATVPADVRLNQREDENIFPLFESTTQNLQLMIYLSAWLCWYSYIPCAILCKQRNKTKNKRWWRRWTTIEWVLGSISAENLPPITKLIDLNSSFPIFIPISLIVVATYLPFMFGMFYGALTRMNVVCSAAAPCGDGRATTIDGDSVPFSSYIVFGRW